MQFVRTGLTIALAAAFASPGSAFVPADAENIAKWIAQLGDDNFQIREQASKKLWEAGAPAEAAIRAAAGSSDFEVSRRAREILDRFKWGIYPDTPKAIVDLIHRYQNGDRSGSGSIIKELFEFGAPGCKAVIKIAAAEEEPGIRKRLYAQISNEMSRAVAVLLLEQDLDTLGLLVQNALDQNVSEHVGNYVAFWALRGKLDEQIAHFSTSPGSTEKGGKAWEIVAYLQRAKGDLRAALAAAEKSGKRELVDDLLVESGQWAQLAGRPIGGELTLDSERLGLRAAYCRLANDTKGYDEAIASLEKLNADRTLDEGTSILAAKALFLNDQPGAALKSLLKSGNRTLAFEVLAVQMKMQQALDLVEVERKADRKQLAELEILSARTLWTLGERDKARAIFARYGELIQPDKVETWYRPLIDAECRVGLQASAMTHAARMMNLEKEQDGERTLLEKLFPKNGKAAEVWWDFYRQQAPSREPLDILNDVDRVLRNKLSIKQARDLVAAAGAALGTINERPDVADQWHLAMAELALAAGDRDLALATLGKSNGSEPLQKLGDLLAEEKKWKSAADCYRRACEADRQQPLPLFLWGNALVLAGQTEEGRRRIEQSHWLPLGHEDARLEFSIALAQRGFPDASKREDELLLRLSQPASYYAAEAVRRIAIHGGPHKNYLGSAEGQERAMLCCLGTKMSFVQPAGYVVYPTMIHRHRVRGYLAAGKLDLALREANVWLEEIPCDVDVPILLLPALEKAGRKKEADELYARANSALEAICKDFPRCALAYNSLAWSSACCGRDLDGGLKQALKAVELDPEVAGYRDTLAEVYFQRGDKAQAIAQQKKALELDPKKAYYRKQLRRMESGDASKPRPPESEDDDDD